MLLIPWLAWSLVYLIFFVISWWIRLLVTRGLAAAAGATGVLALVYVVMLVWASGLLGVKGPSA